MGGLTPAPPARPYIWNPWLTAGSEPGRLAVIADGESCTFGELTERADRLAAGLRAFGLADGATVSASIPSGPRFFALALAALRHGFRLFPVSGRLLAGPSAGPVLRASGSQLHVGADAVGAAVSGLATVPDDELAGAAGPATAAGQPLPREGGLVYATSGTTGPPTVVAQPRPRHPYRGIAVNPRYQAGMTRGPHIMANPAFHFGTLGPALYALQAGSTVVVQRAWSPAGLADLVDRYRADSVFLSPDRLVDVVAARTWASYRPAIVLHGGSLCAPAVKRAAIAMMGPVLHEYYGTSHGIISEITSQEWLRRPGSAGRPLPGVHVTIRRGQEPVPAGETGEICVRQRAAASGEGGGSFVRTGDVGYADGDGYLYVLGRADGGRPLDQVRLEHAMRALPGVTDAAVLAAADARVTCYAETGPHQLDTVAAQLPGLAAQFGLPGLRLDLRPNGTFPRTPSGKIAWADVRAAVPTGGRE